eukprot:g409.t1
MGSGTSLMKADKQSVQVFDEEDIDAHPETWAEENVRRMRLADPKKRRDKRMNAPCAIQRGDGGEDKNEFDVSNLDWDQWKLNHFVEKSDSVKDLLKNSLVNHFLFQRLSEEIITDAISVMTCVQISKGKLVIEQGDMHGDKFYIIGDGLFEIIVDGEVVVTYRKGQNFGELALMYDAARAASVRAKTNGVLWALDRKPFRKFLEKSVLMSSGKVEQILKDSPIFSFSNLADETIKKLAENTSKQSYKAGKVIINQGDVGELFYIVEKGSIACYKGGKETFLLGPGNFFGERSLIVKGRRFATFLAKTDCTVLAIHKEKFKEVYDNSPELALEIDQVHKHRLSLELEVLSKNRRKLEKIEMGDLTIVRIVGKGAYGMVKLVRESKSNRPLAIKVMQKAKLVSMKQTKNVITEKNILQELEHPFIVRLIASLIDRDCVYLATEYLGGGDLFSKLCDYDGCLEPSPASFITACIVSAFSYMHGKKIIYRDLKPENLVFDSYGFIKLVDFGMAKIVDFRTFTVCGTPEYMAPEIIHGTGHGKGADFWSLGVLLYEILCGSTPFAKGEGVNHLEIYKVVDKYCDNYEKFSERKRKTLLKWPSWISSPSLRDLVVRLLTPNAKLRFGSKINASDVRCHPWFSSKEMAIDWEKLELREVEPPLKPCMLNPFDTQNFDDWSDNESAVLKYEETGADYEKLWNDHFG